MLLTKLPLHLNPTTVDQPHHTQSRLGAFTRVNLGMPGPGTTTAIYWNNTAEAGRDDPAICEYWLSHIIQRNPEENKISQEMLVAGNAPQP